MPTIDPRKLVVSGGSKSSTRDQDMSDEEDTGEDKGNEEEEEETFTVGKSHCFAPQERVPRSE